MRPTEKELDQELRDLPVAITLQAADWAFITGSLNWARHQMKEGSSSAWDLTRLSETIRTVTIAAVKRAEEALRK